MTSSRILKPNLDTEREREREREREERGKRNSERAHVREKGGGGGGGAVSPWQAVRLGCDTILVLKKKKERLPVIGLRLCKDSS